jgi:hypothetical protein
MENNCVNRPLETLVMPTPHLWEVDHPYYCNEGNYYAGGCGDEYKSFCNFLSEYADADFDMNLVFRFDWVEQDSETGEPNFNGDDNYRNGILKIFWMGQRKGLYHFSLVEVCRADEPAVIEFLRPRWEHLRQMWAPLA